MPASKQVFRFAGHDLIGGSWECHGCDSKGAPARALLRPVILGGKLVQPLPHVSEIRSYAQAQRTTQTLQRLGRSGIVSAFSDLGILRLLLQVPDLAELRSFAADVLGKLSMHEHEHKSEYLTTLACYFRENNSPQRASRILHVHPNTVAYRVKRIEEITGLRLDNYSDRLIAQVALEILDSLGEEP